MARDRRAEYARRNAAAREAGYKGYGEYRKAQVLGKRQGRAALSPSETRDWSARQTRKQIHAGPSGTVATTTVRGKGYATLTRQLQAHGSNPARVTVTTSDGRRRVLYASGRAADRGSESGKGILEQSGGTLTAAGLAAQMNTSAASRYGGEQIEADDITDVSIELLEGWPNE